MWNYRVIKSKDGVYSIGEAYHNSDGSIWGFTKEEKPTGNDIEELIEDLRMMLDDIDRSKTDVIDESTFILSKLEHEEEFKELEEKISRMTEEELEEYCLRDELACMDHPEFEFVKEL